MPPLLNWNPVSQLEGQAITHEHIDEVKTLGMGTDQQGITMLYDGG